MQCSLMLAPLRIALLQWHGMTGGELWLNNNACLCEAGRNKRMRHLALPSQVFVHFAFVLSQGCQHSFFCK